MVTGNEVSAVRSLAFCGILACGNSKPVTTFAEVWTHLGSFVCAETLPGGDCNDWGCWARLRVWTHQISRCVQKFPTAGARFA